MTSEWSASRVGHSAPTGSSTRNPLNMGLGEPEILSERFGEDHIFCLAGIRTPDHPALSI